MSLRWMWCKDCYKHVHPRLRDTDAFQYECHCGFGLTPFFDTLSELLYFIQNNT